MLVHGLAGNEPTERDPPLEDIPSTAILNHRREAERPRE